MTTTPKFVVAICGGGIGGLTAALALARLSAARGDIHVDLYEAVGAFTEVGAGVGLFRRPWRILNALGVDGELRKLDNVPREGDPPGFTVQLRKADQPKSILFYEVHINPGLLRFHRAVFQRCLADQLDGSEGVTTTHFSKRMVGYSLSPPSSSSFPAPGSGSEPAITLHFADGSSAKCDVLIGADGIHSATRRTLFELAAQELVSISTPTPTSSPKSTSLSNGDSVAEVIGNVEVSVDAGTSLEEAARLRTMIEPTWTGAICYRALIPFEKLEALNPTHSVLAAFQNYVGKGRHVIAYPITHARLVNFVAHCTWPEKEGTAFEGKIVEERPTAELLELFEGWDEEIQQLLQCVEKPSRWAIHAVRPLPQYVHDRVALLGDAAHAMLPHQGSGAGQAIEDAYILASVLASPHTTKDTLPIALSVYDRVRRPHGTDVQARSRSAERLSNLVDPEFSARELELLATLGGIYLEEQGDDGGDGGEGEEGSASERRCALRKLRGTGETLNESWAWAWETEPEGDRVRALHMLEEEVRGWYVH